MSLLWSRRGWILGAVVLIVVLCSVRPGADRLKTRVVNSISLALGRQVEVGSVSVRLLPQPGFELHNFVVHDDPAFSAEPMLRAAEVSASLRFTSLLRGQLEISKLSLSEPSLNLARREDGRWNLEALLERAARIAVAPTGKARSERRPGFPYIQADRGRINFKIGLEKKPYALGDADFGLWQDSENSWGMRLKAQPLRSDLNLNDTGLLSVTGSWGRAGTLRNTPVQFSLAWAHAQLGQTTKLVYGSDAGWRGDTAIYVTVKGTPADLALEARSSVQDFRRYDIVGGAVMAVAARCEARFSSVDRSFSHINCMAPVRDGDLTLSGNVSQTKGSPAYDLTVLARNIPMAAVLGLAHHVKKNIPDDLEATGAFTGNLTVNRNQSGTTWQGRGETSEFRLVSGRSNAELALGTIPFELAQDRARGRGTKSKSQSSVPIVAETSLNVGPFEVPLGASTDAVVRGSLSKSGYSIKIAGDVQLQRLLQLAKDVGVPSAQPAAEGSARIDLQLAGNWQFTVPPRANGKIQLRSIRAHARGLEGPVQIESANLLLTENEVKVQDLNAQMAGSVWRGSLLLPRQCTTPGTCPIHFDLHADEISTDKLNKAFNPEFRKRSWYQIFGSAAATSLPLNVFATGKLSASRVIVHKLVVSKVSATVELNHGRLALSDLRGSTLGGSHTGNWTADFTASPPLYKGSGTFQQIALGELAGLMHDEWIAGSVSSARYTASASGTTLNKLVGSATATIDVDAFPVLFPRITLDNASGPLKIANFSGKLVLEDENVRFEESKLSTADGVYQVSGTASLGRELDLKLERDGSAGFEITGTVAEPQVITTTPHEATAALKP